MYQVRIERKVQKKLFKIPEPYYSKVKKAILNLGINPKPQGYIKLTGRNGFRIRVADYRILYKIIENKLLIDVFHLDSRGSVYKK